MAAPIGAYRDKSFFMNKSGVDYEHLTAILQEGDQVMKERFYLDELFVLRLEDGTDGVIGMVGEGSENEAMHNLTTRGGVGRAYKGGKVVRMLNDAGLNTLPFANTPELIDDTVGLVQAKTLLTTAYYLDSDRYGTNVQINNGSILLLHKDEFIPQNTSIYKDLSVIAYNYIKAGDTIKIWSRVRNPEGEFTTPNYLQVTVKPRLWLAKFDQTYASWANAKIDTVNIYSGLHEMEYFSEVYKDLGMTEYADEGFYIVNGWWYDVRVDNSPQMKAIVVAKGEAIPGQYPPGDPGNPPVDNYIPVSAFFGTTRNQVCLKAMGMDPDDLYHFYINTANNRYYTDNIGTSYVSDGYYVFPDYTPSNQRWTMTAGFRSMDGNCI